MRILPAIDLKNGKCVRLLKGDFNKITEYNSNPLDQVNIFLTNQLNYLHIVDLDGAETGNQLNRNVIKQIARISNLSLQVGGGIRSIENVASMLEMGVSRVIIGTALFKNSFIKELERNFDNEQIVLALDFKIINKIPMIYTHGWQDNSEIALYDFLRNNSYFTNILATDISLDGAMKGPSFHEYGEVLNSFPLINLIASGGIRSLDDLNALKEMNINESIVGKAIYEQNISLLDLKNDY
jgi:phosphoribosylformimino-5-aminoimidazole carboxamide ribotide isomerase